MPGEALSPYRPSAPGVDLTARFQAGRLSIMKHSLWKTKKDGRNKTKKSAVTRAKILAAARRVFSRHPYKAATMRMIAADGDFDHPLIRYYFPTKADLFKAVMIEVCEEFYEASVSWMNELKALSPEKSIALYLDRFLAFNQKNPEALKIFAINSSVLQDDPTEIPGYEYIPEVFAKTRTTFQAIIPLKASSEEIEAFLTCFNALLVNFLGADTCHAMILGMDPTSEAYNTWIKNTLLFLFTPLAQKLVFGTT